MLIVSKPNTETMGYGGEKSTIPRAVKQRRRMRGGGGAKLNPEKQRKGKCRAICKFISYHNACKCSKRSSLYEQNFLKYK